MALGPFLLVGGKLTSFQLPYQVMYKLPVLSTGRDPQRFYSIAMLGFGVLVAFGLKAFIEYLPHSLPGKSFKPSRLRTEKWLAGLAVSLFLGVTLGGFVVEAGKARIDPPDWPPFYQQLALDKENYAILELPLFTEKGRGEDTYEAYQSLHQKQRFGGRLARDHKLTNPNNFIKKASLFHDFFLIDPREQTRFYPAQDFLTRTDYTTQGSAILNYYKVRYIVIYKAALQEAFAAGQKPRFDLLISQVLGPNPPPYYEDRLTTVYKVPPSGQNFPPLTLDVGNGWFTSQTDAGHPYRWADLSGNQPAELYTMNLTGNNRRATLSFQAFAFKQSRTLKIAIDGYEAATYQLNPAEGEKAISLELSIPPGNHTLSLSSPEPSLPTIDPAKDGRLLSFGAYNVKLN